MAQPILRIHVHLDHGRSPTSWTKRFREGRVNSQYSYGYEHVLDGPASDIRLSFSEDGPDHRITRVLRKVQRRLIGVDLGHVWHNRKSIRGADAVWTHTEYEWLAVALLMRVGIARPAVLLAQSVWLWERWERLSWLRRAVARLLMDTASFHVTLSRENAALARTRTRRPVAFVPFGIAPLETSPANCAAATTGTVLVSPGNDPDRDWNSLYQVALLRPDWEVRILSRTARVSGPIPPNLTIAPAADSADLVREYLDATAVVVPLSSNHHASGITVGLEALSLRRPLVITDIGGVHDYFAGAAALVGPRSAAEIIAAVEAGPAASSPDADTGRFDVLRQRGLTDADYASRLLLATRSFISTSSLPSDLSALAPMHPRSLIDPQADVVGHGSGSTRATTGGPP